MPIEIEEIITRSVQGVTRPFVCRGEDNEVYYVKGMGAGRRSQICELVAGRLAVAFGIPIAPFEIVTIPRELLSVGGRDDLADLGPGLAFGSRRRGVTELTHTRVADVPPQLATDVLVFDLWINNEDRTLTDLGGNPNLFWDVGTEELVVFDHNQAFDPGFNKATFLDQHAFASYASGLFSDWVARESYRQRMETAMQDLPLIWGAVPAEWMYVDLECTVPTNFDFAVAEAILQRSQSTEFWSAQ